MFARSRKVTTRVTMALREGGGRTHVHSGDERGVFASAQKNTTPDFPQKKKFLKLFPVGFRTELDIRFSPQCKLNASEK